jgi:hypothetical protein
MDLSAIAHVEGGDGTGRLVSLFGLATGTNASQKPSARARRDGVIVKNF